MTKKRWLRWGVGVALTPFILLLLVQLTAPLWLDAAAVKAEVAKLVSDATGGRAQYGGLALRFLPRPRVVLTEVSFDLPGTVNVQAHNVLIDIRLLPLFRGSVEPRRLRLVAPRIALTIPKSAPDTTRASAKPFSLAGTDSQLHTVLAMIESRAPGLEADVDGGHLELDLPSQPPLILQNVDLTVDVEPDAIQVTAGVTTPWVQRVTVHARVAPGDLSGTLGVSIGELDAAALGGALAVSSGWPVRSGVLTLQFDARFKGLSDAQVSLSTRAPSAALRFGAVRMDLSGIALDVAGETHAGAATITLKQLALKSPRIGASGTLTRSSTGALVLSAQLADLDLTVAQSLLASLAPAVPALASLPVTVTRGTLAHATLTSRAATFGDLFSLPAITISGALESTDATLTVFQDLRITGASANVALTGGRLHADALQARVGATAASDGTFDLDLNPAVPPMRASITVAADLAQGFAIAGRVLGKDSAASLGAITGLRGSVLAHVTIGGNVDTVVPRVDFSMLDLSAHYAAIPFAVHVSDGGGSYTTKALTIRSLRGTIGHSTFDSLDAGLSLAGPMVVSATRGSVHLALAELFAWAATQPKLAKPLDGVKSVGGALSVSIAALSLPVKTPDSLTFRAAAVPEMIAVDAPKYGPSATVNGGVIHVTQNRVNATSVAVSVLDARLFVSGGTENYRDSTSELLVFAKGAVGLDALAWAFEKAALPPALKLRGALRIADASVSLRTSAGIGASGTITVEGGPEIGFDLHSADDHLQIDRFTLRDDASNVSARATIDGPRINALWKGRLAGSSLVHIFAEPPVRLDFIDGDLRVEGDLKAPKKSRATGTLTGAAIHLPPALKIPLVIDRLSLEARDTSLVLRTADLSSGESRGSITGSIAFRGDKFIVDASVHGDTVIIPVTVHHADSAAPVRAPGAAPAPTNAEKETKFIKALHEIPAEGKVRVDIGVLHVGELEFTPLQASAAIEGTRIDLALTHAALCGIAMSGGLVLEHDTLDVRASLAAHAAPLAGAVKCLSNQHIDITGRVTVAGSIVSRAVPGRVVDNLRGTFQLTATDGRINKFDELARVLKVVNVTQVLVGQGADFQQGGMAYKTVAFDLAITGRLIDVRSFSLDASGLDAGAHGTVDFDTRALNIDVLVAPVKTLNWVISHTPIIRSIFGGTILALPVHVGGTIDRPLVVPLGAQAVSGRLFEILGNTVKLPADLIKTTDSTTKKP